MWTLGRWFFTFWFIYLLAQMRQDSPMSPGADLASAASLAMAIVVGLVVACFWAPILGGKIASPVTDVLANGRDSERRGGLMHWIRWCVARGHRRTALALCFIEGITQPELPAHFSIALSQTRPGSWLEKVFAREVYRFSNVANCVIAHDILLLRHDIHLPSHSTTEVQLALFARSIEPRPEMPPLVLPPAPPTPTPARNSRIRLFTGAGAGAGSDPEGRMGNPQPPEETDESNASKSADSN